VKSPRSGKTLSTHELARFLALLAETGNFALACDRLGRAKSGLYKRRARDRAFAAECVAALAQARMGAARPEHGRRALKAAWNTLTLSTHAGRPQLRRAVSGSLTRAGLDTFLKTLAATGNTRFAAHSVGVAPSSLYARRRRDPAFARAMDAAIDTAMAALELRVIEASGVFAEEDDVRPELVEGREIHSLTAAEALHFLTLHSRQRKTEGGL
jgi:hypothetical protein